MKIKMDMYVGRCMVYYSLHYSIYVDIKDVCHSHAKILYRFFLTNSKQKEQTQTTHHILEEYKNENNKNKNNAHHCGISKICCLTLFCFE